MLLSFKMEGSVLKTIKEVGVIGFEPMVVVSKTSALPLGYTPEMLKSGIEPLTSGFSVQHSTTELLELSRYEFKIIKKLIKNSWDKLNR